MVSGGEPDLVSELTVKLNELRASNDNEDLTARLQRELALLLQPSSGASSSSFPSSPVLSPPHLAGTSPAFPTALQGDATDALSEALIQALQRERDLARENVELRTAYQRATNVNEIWRGELQILRSRLGISFEELAEMESAADDDRLASGSRSPGRQRSGSTSYSYSPTSSILIPGTSPSPSSYRRRSRTSSSRGGSSTRTALTTPSSSYPLTGAPHPTPISTSPRIAAPSPASSFRSFPAAALPSLRAPARLADDDLRPPSPPISRRNSLGVQ